MLTLIAVCNDIDPLPLCPLMCSLANNLGFLHFALTSIIRGGGSTAMTTAVGAAPVHVGVPMEERVPWVGELEKLKEKLLPSVSVPESAITLEVSSFVVADWLFATGASFAGLTAMVTVAVSSPPLPSVAL